MKIFKLLLGIFICLTTSFVSAQNLLNTSTWTIGSGSVAGFPQNGLATENIRELGKNHVGEDVVLWKAVPDSNSDPDGGWNSSYLTIDNTQKYRLSVWIKKTNSIDGTTYFGCQQWQPDVTLNTYTILNLNNSINTNPYFWVGDLPKLDRWYLLVGFIHGKNSSGTTNEGAIYDGVTGEFVQNITDFKFNASTSVLRHRAYLYYDTNTLDRQYFYEPRLELVNGGQPTIEELLKINPNSKLLFAYDNSGNQKQRFYCPDAGSCPVPNPPAGKIVNEKEVAEENIEEYDTSNQLRIYPNPTKDIVHIHIQTELLSKVESVKLYNINSSLVKVLKINKSNNQVLEVDLTGKSAGVYFLHIHMSDGSPSITKKIIKE